LARRLKANGAPHPIGVIRLLLTIEEIENELENNN